MLDDSEARVKSKAWVMFWFGQTTQLELAAYRLGEKTRVSFACTHAVVIETTGFQMV